jgi:glycosyltransferase involved in cell wall biosynthesis
MKKPGLLFVINDLRPGGAEMFWVRLGAYVQEDFDIHILSLNPERDDPNFVDMMHQNLVFSQVPFPVPEPSGIRSWLYWKLNAIATLFGREGFYVKLRDRYKRNVLGKEMKRRNIRIINTSSSSSDSFSVHYLKKNFGIPAVITMHSSYNEECWDDFGSRERLIQTATGIFEGADHIFYTADHNIRIFSLLESLKIPKPEKVYLGYAPASVSVSRADLSIPEKAFVITMMARGIEEKGWQCLLNAFERLQTVRQESLLILIHTDTDYMKDLKIRYAENAAVRFCGYVADPSAILYHSDCSVLPSHFPESLPYAVIESLAAGTPVFATPVAEIPEMLRSDSGVAGGLVPFHADGKADADVLTGYLIRAATDTEQLANWKASAKQAFRKFSMEVCGEHYKMVFFELINGKG